MGLLLAGSGPTAKAVADITDNTCSDGLHNCMVVCNTWGFSQIGPGGAYFCAAGCLEGLWNCVFGNNSAVGVSYAPRFEVPSLYAVTNGSEIIIIPPGASSITLGAGRYNGTTFVQSPGSVTNVSFYAVPLSATTNIAAVSQLPWVLIGSGVYNPSNGFWEVPWNVSQFTSPGYLLATVFADPAAPTNAILEAFNLASPWTSPPLITQDIVSETLTQGQTATLTVAAIEGPFTYQWQSGPAGSGIFINLTDGGQVSGSAGATLTINNVTPANAADYRVVVANAFGSSTSSVATLTVSLSYSINVHSGFNLIANQLDHGSNTLDEIMPTVPDGSVLFKYDNAGLNWLTAAYSASSGGWTPGSLTLSPGEGAFFQSPTNFTLTFSGTPHVPVLPVAIPSGACYLLSRQTNDIGDYTNIVGLAPVIGVKVYEFTGTGYNVFSFISSHGGPGTWTPSEPTVAVGQAVWISSTNGGIPVPTPTNTFLVFQGLLNSSLGAASLSANAASNQLSVQNLGSSGQDGVAITLPANTAGLVVGWPDLDVSNTLPVGAYVQSQVVGTLNGVSGVLGKLTVRKAGTGNYVTSADYSALGANTYTVAAYFRGVLQAQAINQSGTSLATANIPPKGEDVGDYTPPLSEEWPFTNALVSIGTGAPVMCDELIVRPENVTFATVSTGFQIVASQVPGFTITNETIILVQQGLLNASLGKAALSVSGNTLAVANIGSSGQDGVSIAANCTNCGDIKTIADGLAQGQATDLVAGMDVTVNEIGPTNAVPVGATFRARVVGSLDGVTYGPLGALILTKTGSSNFVLSADFSPVGTSNCTIEIYRSGVLVTQLTHQNSSSQVGIAVSDQAQSSGKKHPQQNPKPGRQVSYVYLPRFGQSTNVAWSLSGSGLTLSLNGAQVPFDELDVTPENVPFTSPPTAFQLTAARSPTLTLTSENVSFVYQSLINTSLGHASLAPSGNQLTVSNLGSSGQDGVAVALPDYAVGIALSCPPSSGSNTPPLGAYFQSQVVGTAAGVSNDVLETVTVTYLGPTNHSIAADFSAVGASNYTVVASLNGVVTGKRIHVPPSLAVADVGPNKLDWEDWHESLSVAFAATAQLSFGDGTSVPCDHIAITAENVTFPTRPTAFQVVASQVPSFSIASENLSLVYQGLTNTSLGNAAAVYWGFKVSSNRVFIPNIGSSGQDGVEIALNTGNYFAGSWLDLDPNDSLPVGAYLESQMVGTAGSITNGVLGSQFCTKAGSSNYVISVDYSPLGSSTHTLQVYNGTTLVAQMTGQGGAACATVGLPPWVCTINPDLDNGWPKSTAITLNGGPTVVGTELLIIPEGGVPVSSISAARILAANIPSLVLTNETANVNFNGLGATPVGNATLQTSGGQMAVYNIGSSGQDGVSFTLPIGPAVDVLWQPFDPSNSLPAGAYLQEQISGTAGGVSGNLGSITMSKRCGACPGEGNGLCIPCLTNFLLSADFSPIGVSNFTLQAYLNGALVAQATNQSGPALAYCNVWGDSGCTPKPFGGGFDWTNDPARPPYITFAGVTVRCDHLFIIPEGVSGTATALQLTASQVPEITFTGSRQTLYYQGLLHTSTGGASLSVQSNQLTVANLGSSCQDGVEIDVAPSPYFGLSILPQWPAGAGTVTMTELGSANGQAGQPVGQNSIAFDGTSYSYSFDFSALGASNYTVAIFNGGQLVYENQNNNNPGPAFVTALPPFKYTYLPPDPTPPFVPPDVPDPSLAWLDFPRCVMSVPNGGSNTTGDQVLVFPNQPTSFAAVSGARIQACGNISQLVISGESLSSANVEASALGSATFVPSGPNLALDNLGSSGQDGVFLALANGVTGLATAWQDLDPSNALPVGAYVEHQMIGTAGSVSNGVLGSAICTKAGISNYVISVDYSPLGASAHTLQVYNGGTLVGQLTGQVGAVCATTKLPPGTCTINPFLNQEWGSPTPITLSGGPTLMGTELLMLPEGGASVGSLTAEQILTAEIPSLTITTQKVLTATYGGLHQSPLGNATLTLVNGSLAISNLGSSGQDGVAMTLPQGNVGVAAHWLNLDPSNTLPIGAYILQQMYGNAVGITNGLLGSLQVTKTGTGNYALTANFPHASSPQCLVQVYNGVALVASATNSSAGTLCFLPKLPFDTDTGTGPTFPVPDEGGGTCIGGITWHDGSGPISIQFNGAPIQGDMILVSSLSAPPVSAMTGLNLLASGIPQIVITNETSVAAFAGLAHSSLGNATLSVAASTTNKTTITTVDNLGSSGQDGVSISFPGGLNSWGADWQDPDLNGRAPAGAYLRESVIGTGGSVTNGVLAILTTTKAGASNYITTADFSPMGASTFTAAVYNGSNLISQVGGLSNGTPILSIDWSLSVHIHFHPFRIVGDGSVGPINVDPEGFDLVATGNNVVFTPEGPVQPDVSALQVQASQVPSLTITNEAVGPLLLVTKLTSNGLQFQWLGNGVLQQSPNLGSWADSTNFVSPVTVPIGRTNQFFRIRQPTMNQPF
jgi:hypothetical protein